MTKLAKTNLISLIETTGPTPVADQLPRHITNMTDEELIETALGCTIHKKARAIIEIFDKGNLILRRESAPELCQEIAKISKIDFSDIKKFLAGIEFAARRLAPQGTRIREPGDIMPYLSYLTARKQEHFICASLNGAHEIINIRIVTIGLANMTQAHPREVFADPITDRACAIIIAHNHPSGDLTPSSEDKSITKRIEDSGKLLGIRLLDHVIFSTRGHFSFAAAGLLSQN
jgi:DNA repair protein RadC